MIEFISQPWPWYVSGPIIGLVMLSLVFFGETFGLSSNLRAFCTICGANRASSFFEFEWKNQIWNLMVILGAVIGGIIAGQFLMTDPGVSLNPQTVAALQEWGISNPGASYMPDELFGAGAASAKGIALLFIGGLFVGFGARYAGGCTSGHAISGLSNLQLPSLIAVCGFFIGGMFTTFFILPLLL